MRWEKSAKKQMLWWQDVIGADSSSQAEQQISKRAINVNYDSPQYVRNATTNSNLFEKNRKHNSRFQNRKKSRQQMWNQSHYSRKKPLTAN